MSGSGLTREALRKYEAHVERHERRARAEKERAEKERAEKERAEQERAAQNRAAGERAPGERAEVRFPTAVYMTFTNLTTSGLLMHQRMSLSGILPRPPRLGPI